MRDSAAQSPDVGSPAWGASLDEWWQSLRRSIPVAVLALLVTFAAIFGIIGILRAAVPSIQSFQTVIRFQGADLIKGRYPTGARFAVGDLLSPAVVERVYEDNKIASLGITQAEFVSGLTVSSFSPDIELITARYREKLSDRRLTFVERQQIERELGAEVDDARGRLATITWTVSSRLGVPEVVGRKVTLDIPSHWANQRITEFGVLERPEGKGQSAIVDPGLINDLDPIISVERLALATDLLLKRFDEIDASGSNEAKKAEIAALLSSVVDTATGHSVRSAIVALNELNDFRLPQLGTRAVTAQVHKPVAGARAQVGLLLAQSEAKLVAANRRIGLIEAAIRDLDGDGARPRLQRPDGEGDARTTQNSGIVLGDQFFERLIGLIEKSVDKDARQEIRNKKAQYLSQIIRARAEVAQLESHVARMRQTLASISALEASGAPSRTPASDTDLAALKAELARTAADLNGFHVISQRLHKAVDPNRLSYRNGLYRTEEIAGSRIYTTWHPILNAGAAMIALAGSAGVALLTLLGAMIIRQRNARRART